MTQTYDKNLKLTDSAKSKLKGTKFLTPIATAMDTTEKNLRLWIKSDNPKLTQKRNIRILEHYLELTEDEIFEEVEETESIETK